MPAPDWEGPLNSFLSTVMKSRYGSAEGKLGQQKLALEQQKFNAEQANHQADMQQRAKQFGDELDFRKASLKGQQDQMDYMRGRDNQNDLRQLTEHGAFPMATPQDQNTLTTPAPMTNPAQVLMPRAQTQPVGPQVPQDIAAQNDPTSLPLQAPQVPVNVQLPAAAQVPDPANAIPIPRPLGDPSKDNQWYQKTPQAMVLEAAQAKKQAEMESWTKYTPSMDKFVKSLDLGVDTPWEMNEPMDPKVLETFKTMADLKGTIASKERMGQDTDSMKMFLSAQANDAKMRMAELKALKGDGGADDINDMTDSVVKTGDPKSIPAKFKPQVTADLKKRYNLPFPSEAVTSSDNDRVTAAQSLKQFTRNLEENLSDPVLLHQLSPLMGRGALLQEQIGKNFGLDPEHEAKMQTILNQLNSMNALDVRAQIGGRASYQMFNAFKDANPNARMDPNMFMGALHGMEFAANAALQSVNDKRWGVGNSPPGFKESLTHNQSVINKPNPAWANAKDKANYIPLGTIRKFADPDKPGSQVIVRRNVEDGKYYEVKD